MDIIAWDQNLLLQLNGLHNQFFDTFMWFATDEISWLPFFAVLLFSIYKTKPREFIFILIAITLTVLVCDQVSGLFKDWIARPRPTREPAIMEQVHTVNNYRGGHFGFFSAHAANTFGIAVLLSLIMKHRLLSLILIIWAILESYSRIYLGVHYPLDIITGIAFGSFVGYSIYKLECKLSAYFNLKEQAKISFSEIKVILFTFIIVVFMLGIASKGINDFLL